MKTPQEIAAECWIGHDHDEFVQEYPKIGLACGMCLDNTVAALAAAREEGCKEAWAELGDCDECRPCKTHWRKGLESALASQPKPDPADRGRGVRIELTDEQRAALTVPAGAIPKPAVTCDGCKRGLRLQCGIVPPRHFDVDGLGEYVYTPCTAKLE